jgi:hypothetical protein
VAALREATDEAILAVPGVTQRHLSALRSAFAASEDEANDVGADDAEEDAEPSFEVTDVGEAEPPPAVEYSTNLAQFRDHGRWRGAC